MGSKVFDGGLQKDDVLGWGKSLPVDSVQEIVRKDSQSVPDRYIREHVDRPNDAELSTLSSDNPIIDFSLLLSRNKDEGRKLDLTCKEWGFFQIINHGIEEEVLQKMKNAAAGFFQLSLEEKKKYSMAENDLQGYGQAFVVSEQQKLDWGDMIFLMTQPAKIRKMNYWPTTIADFVEAVDVYSSEVNRVAEELLANLSMMMNMDKGSLLGLHGEMKQGIRVNYYPTCSRPDLVLGVSPHSDGSSITILLQDDEIVGLQIQHKGHWVTVKPVPNALVVNIGDVMESHPCLGLLLVPPCLCNYVIQLNPHLSIVVRKLFQQTSEAWSNGMYKSIEHRAVTNATGARMSLAAFLLPDPEIEIGPLDQMVDNHHRPRMYRNFKYIDYIRHTFEQKMEGKVHTRFLKLENK